MSVLEIVGGVLLILASLVITFMVLAQQPSGNGLSGAIGGGEALSSEARTRTTDAVLAKYTKIAAIVFLVVTLAVSLFSVFAK